MNIKNLVISGCSFTDDEYIYTWATYLQEMLKAKHKELKYNNYGRTSAGNGYISSSLIYGINEALKTSSPDELLVGVMWSGSNRYEVYKSDVELYDCHTTGTKNPTGFVQDRKNWILMNHHWKDELSSNYYKVFHDEIGSYIKTYENILKIQWFLSSHRIKYFMSTFAPSSLPEEEFKDHPSLRYLNDLIDWSHFLPVKSCIEWCVSESGLPGLNDSRFSLYARHPSEQQHNAFSERVIIPHLKNKGYIV